MKLFASLSLLLAAGIAQADNPLVLLDTDRGPVLVELDAELAPALTDNFLQYVEAGRYDRTLVDRVLRKADSDTVGVDVVQAGGFTETGAPIEWFDSLSTSLGNGLSNVRGTLGAMLPQNSSNQPNLNAVTSPFYFNVTDNSAVRDSRYPVFGRVVYGMANLEQILATPRISTSRPQPIRPPLIKRAVQVAAFPVLDIHAGSWYDPDAPGRGFNLKFASDPDNADGATIVVVWYDYFEGQQVWMNGSAGFDWGDDQIVVPLQITRGGEFGEDFDPAQVESTADWGSLTVRFTACDAATFTYESAFGSGTIELEPLSQPLRARCD